MAAEKLNVRASALDRLVNSARGKAGDAKQRRALDLPEPEPWPEAVDGARLLDDITKEITRYVVVASTPPAPSRCGVFTPTSSTVS